VGTRSLAEGKLRICRKGKKVTRFAGFQKKSHFLTGWGKGGEREGRSGAVRERGCGKTKPLQRVNKCDLNPWGGGGRGGQECLICAHPADTWGGLGRENFLERSLLQEKGRGGREKAGRKRDALTVIRKERGTGTGNKRFTSNEEITLT